MKEVIKTLIKNFHNRKLPKTIKRDTEIPLDTGKIITVIGPRRTGKTYLLFQTMEKIKDKTNILYINFEDERLDFDRQNLNLILEAYFELYPKKSEKDIYLFFDEIQEIENWQKFVRRVYDTITKKIFITGSSSKLLSKEIASSLRGRTISYEILGLSFSEFLRFNNIKKDIISSKGKALTKKMFQEYLNKGTFPEVVTQNPEIREKTLRAYLDVMIFRDLIERYSISNAVVIKKLINKLLANTGKEYSIKKIYNTFKSQNIKISKDSLYQYVDNAEEAYIFFTLRNFSESESKQVLKKSYSVDTGLSQLTSHTLSEDYGRLFETLVFLHLKRKYENIYFYKNGNECDFVIREKNKVVKAIQVCSDLNDNNKEREIEGLLNAMERFNLQQGILLTNEEVSVENNRIKAMPAWKWLLD